MEEEEDNSVEDLTSALARTVLSSPWTNAPSYQPLYLDTETEYLPPAPATPKNLKKLEDSTHRANARDNANEWGHEAYEASRGVDEVFERFAKRVGVRGEQCVRYVLLLFLNPPFFPSGVASLICDFEQIDTTAAACHYSTNPQTRRISLCIRSRQGRRSPLRAHTRSSHPLQRLQVVYQ